MRQSTDDVFRQSQSLTAPVHPFSATSKSTPMNRQVPPEIIQLIVEASLDHSDIFGPSFYGPQPRYATLRSCSLLNSAWCGASQAELVKWVLIRTEDSAIRFLELAEQRGGTLDGVKDMFVQSQYFTDASTFAKLLRCAPQLINLRVGCGSVDIVDLAQLQRLRRLELVGCSIVGSPSSSLLHLPQLQRLEINNCRVSDSARHFLTPTFLPQLRHLDVENFDSVAPLIPQLESITSAYVTQNYTLLSTATSLLLLSLPRQPVARRAMLSKLPTLPPFLHLKFGRDWREGVVAMEALLEAKKSGLRVILLNDYEIGDSIDVLIQQFQARGVRVLLVDKDLYFEGAIVEMEKIRAKEKRVEEEAGARRR